MPGADLGVEAAGANLGVAYDSGVLAGSALGLSADMVGFGSALTLTFSTTGPVGTAALAVSPVGVAAAATTAGHWGNASSAGERLLNYSVKGKDAAASRGIWKITQEGTERAVRHRRFGRFSKSKSDGLWWSRDQAGHGGSKWKVFEETADGLKWRADADEFGDFITGKHKSEVGQLMPWSQLNEIAL